MKNIKIILVFLLMAAGSTFGQETAWKIDPVHSKVQFTVSHLVISEVTGYFRNFEGQLQKTKDDFSDATVQLALDVKSIDTDNEKRDNHLKSDDFFAADKFPQIKFKSTSFTKVGENKFKVYGNLTMRDVTKPVVLDVTYNGTIKDPWGNERSAFKIEGSVNRFDFNLKWNALMEAGGAVVGKTVDILCNVEMVKQVPVKS